ncbi:NAD(P)/FAD-dependent oxidoreductase [Hirschia baltica]|uniref:FAD-dependent pyridine nucleotide-disulphide oxidoreductase n=1 Tax=Hirschia baltica (strain ATCC 49814 / DSM 5838 / IFAM 1418) TaxID=582402 RepID=C6XQW4_HIRBI|nr:FAD-dependent oxidoreductase [Hirschia baltica]ACT60495.1 FAD-dependent pyridine nucleotide-disulphide oxidoreductase [Hirschia baltica ATCC 49814]
MEKIIIIGGGQAGAQAIISLRQSGFEGEITLVSAEKQLPYQRPPLSKAFLKGEMDEERLYFRPEDFYQKQNVTVISGVKATQINKDAKTVELENGNFLSYTKLLLATGAPPRKLPFDHAHLSNVHYLRTLEDSRRLAPTLSSQERIVVIGAGYIGLEVAAVARTAGRDVTVLELADRVLARVASEPVSSFYQDLHRSAGVELMLDTMVENFIIKDNKINSIKLNNGTELACGSVLVGIGAVPETKLAQDAGLEIDNGIIVDKYAQTSDPNIWAAGDCANFPYPRYEKRMRLESVPNAIEQAKVVAKNMLGGDSIHNPLPWFWSDQYDVKLQTVGLMQGFDTLIIRGKPQNKSFSVWYFKENKLLALDALNDAPSFMIGKKLLATDTPISPEQAEDTKFNLRSLF